MCSCLPLYGMLKILIGDQYKRSSTPPRWALFLQNTCSFLLFFPFFLFSMRLAWVCSIQSPVSISMCTFILSYTDYRWTVPYCWRLAFEYYCELQSHSLYCTSTKNSFMSWYHGIVFLSVEQVWLCTLNRKIYIHQLPRKV